MWKCTRCGECNIDGLVCRRCGGSPYEDYIAHMTLYPLPERVRKEYGQTAEDLDGNDRRKKSMDGEKISEQKQNPWTKRILVLIVGAAVLLAAAVWFPEGAAQRSGKGVLMKNPMEDVSEAEGEAMLGGPYDREEICSVTFLNSLDDRPQDWWDVSEAGDGSVAAWAEESAKGYDLFIAGEGGVKANADSSELFACCINLETIRFGGNFDTSSAKTLDTMFYGCSSLSSVDEETLDVSAAEETTWLFAVCESLEEIDLSGWETSRVTDMGYMFYKCDNLKSLDLGGMDTSQVTRMDFMFYDCGSLEELDIGGFDTSAVTNMEFMFRGCGSLRELDVSGFDTSNVQNMDHMFYRCSRLEKLDVSGFDTSNVLNMDGMFYECSSLTELDISGFDTSQVLITTEMFYGCNGLTELDLSVFDEFGEDMLTGTRWE